MFRVTMNKIIVLLALLWANHVNAGSYSIVENVKCKPESDVCETSVKILNNGSEVSEILGLEGPTFHSLTNAQILSCESNAVFGTTEIRVFDYKAKEVFSYPHLGYQRDCGVFEKAPLYWFLYNIVENGNPKNSLVVLDSTGKEVFKSGSTLLTKFEFYYKAQLLTLTTSNPDWPG